MALALTGPGFAARDRGADGKFSERKSIHFQLYQDVAIDRFSGAGGSRQFEVSVLEILENAYGSVGQHIGLRPRTRIDVWIYDPAVFDQRFQNSFRFRAAGFFNGAIHIRGGTRVGAQLVRTLHHEYVHAAFHATRPSLVVPAFINEGVAEWFENLALGKRGLSDGEQRVLKAVANQRGLLPTRTLLRTGFVDVPSNQAGLAYLQSYATIEYLVRRYGVRSLRDFVSEIFRSGDMNRALRSAYGLSLADLEAKIRQELR